MPFPTRYGRPPRPEKRPPSDRLLTPVAPSATSASRFYLDRSRAGEAFSSPRSVLRTGSLYGGSCRIAARPPPRSCSCPCPVKGRGPHLTGVPMDLSRLLPPPRGRARTNDHLARPERGSKPLAPPPPGPNLASLRWGRIGSRAWREGRRSSRRLRPRGQRR